MQIKPQPPKPKKPKAGPATKPALRLGKDGRLQVAGSQKAAKPANRLHDDGDIGDIWAEQRFISHQEMVLEERRRKARERRQRELGLIGRAKAALVGDPAVKQKLRQKELQKALMNGSKPGHTTGQKQTHQTHQAQQNRQPPRTGNQAKTVEINIALPSVSVRSVARTISSRVRALVPATFIHAITKTKRRRLSLGIVAVALVAIAAFGLLRPQPDSQTTSKNNNGSSGNQAAGQLTQGTPEYDALLPTGKDIASFGGWTRVSPKDKDPVFAYVDKIGSIQINVSQQPLPDNLKTDDTEQQIEQLANSFSATEKITVNGSIAHVGTSAKGPQSLIMAKDDLLILIKSTAPLTTAQWTEYINNLK